MLLQALAPIGDHAASRPWKSSICEEAEYQNNAADMVELAQWASAIAHERTVLPHLRGITLQLDGLDNRRLIVLGLVDAG